jgi:hypothetical protein
MTFVGEGQRIQNGPQLCHGAIKRFRPHETFKVEHAAAVKIGLAVFDESLPFRRTRLIKWITIKVKNILH